MIEAIQIFCLIWIVVGGIMTAIFGKDEVQKEPFGVVVLLVIMAPACAIAEVMRHMRRWT